MEIESLARLQELDLKIARLKNERDLLISSLFDLDGLIQKAQKDHSLALNVVASLEKGRDRVAGFREVNRRKLIQAKMREAEELRQFSASLQEREQKYEQDIEFAKKELEPLAAELKKLTQDRNSRIGDLSKRANDISAEIVSSMLERNDLVSQVAPRSIAEYDQARYFKQ